MRASPQRWAAPEFPKLRKPRSIRGVGPSYPGCSVAVNAPVLGAGYREFDSLHPDQITACSLVWPKCLPRTQETGGSNPPTLTNTPLSSNGRAAVLHAADRGSIPRRGTTRVTLQVRRRVFQTREARGSTGTRDQLPPPADLASGLRTRNGEFESSWGLHFCRPFALGRRRLF